MVVVRLAIGGTPGETRASEPCVTDAERGPECVDGRVREGFRPAMVRATAEETKRLLRAYGLSRDRDIRDQLVDSYMPLVKNLCRRFQLAREPQEDLIRVGVIGFLNAIEKFDPERARVSRLSRFLRFWGPS